MKKIILFVYIFSFFIYFSHTKVPESYKDEPDNRYNTIGDVSTERTMKLQKKAKQLPGIIAEIQQKVASDRYLEEQFAIWQDMLEQIKKISFLLQDELYAKTASRKQFEVFYVSFYTLYAHLKNLNKQFIVPEFKLQPQDINFSLKIISDTKAQKITNKIIEELIGLKKKNFFADFKKLEKVYELIAAKIKTEQIKKEHQAQAAQQKEFMNDWMMDGDYDWQDSDEYWNF